MKFICDAPDKNSWFRRKGHQFAGIDPGRGHAVAKHYRREREQAMGGFKPASMVNFE